MKKRNAQKQRLTPFERETLRRRQEMLRNLSGRQATYSVAYLRALPRSVRLSMMSFADKLKTQRRGRDARA